MSTLAIVAIVIGALIVLAIVVSVARRARSRRELGHMQTDATRDDAHHHRERAEERAKRAQVEAELDEERAGQRERQLDT